MIKIFSDEDVDKLEADITNELIKRYELDPDLLDDMEQYGYKLEDIKSKYPNYKQLIKNEDIQSGFITETWAAQNELVARVTEQVVKDTLSAIVVYRDLNIVA